MKLMSLNARKLSNWFSTYETLSIGTVMMGNKASCKIAGIGTIQIKMFDRVVRTIGNVRHVPHLKRNMISLSILDSKGYQYTCEGRVLKISKGTCIVIKGRKILPNYMCCRVLPSQVVLPLPY